jgi:hypothetical protein
MQGTSVLRVIEGYLLCNASSVCNLGFGQSSMVGEPHIYRGVSHAEEPAASDAGHHQRDLRVVG